MEDEEESQGRISVTVAATPALALALPAQNRPPAPLRSSNGGHFGAVGSREDCWTESATSVLIEAWGERYLNLSRGNLKQNHWKDVADVVAAEDDHFKTPKTDVQCKNRIDTVKKKFKAEKAKIAAGGPPSCWPFYHRLDHLIGSTVPTPNPRAPSGTSSGQLLSGSGPIRSTRIQNQKLKKRKSKMDSDSEPDPPSPESTDSLPPETKYPYKRARTHREFDPLGLSTSFDFAARSQGPRERESSGWEDSVRELTRAIVKFGEIYEKAERAKVHQMVEMEKQRMKFTKELEIQRMQFFVKTQLEIKQNRRTENRNNNNNNSHIRHRSNDNNDACRHSDSSS